MKEVYFEDLNYIGGDIVSELISNNKSNFQTKNINFKNLDLINDVLPFTDLIFVEIVLSFFL